MKIKAILYIVLPLVLGLVITYASMYFLHPLDPSDWYRYGFPVGWKNVEATGEGFGTPIFTFYSPTGFLLDVLFWYGIALVLIVVVTYSAHPSSLFLKGLMTFFTLCPLLLSRKQYQANCIYDKYRND